MAKHDKLDDRQRQDAAKFYGDGALKLLRHAARKGYQDVAHLKKDTDLDPCASGRTSRSSVHHIFGRSCEKTAPFPSILFAHCVPRG